MLSYSYAPVALNLKGRKKGLMENLGRLYGSRISKKGNHLNLIILIEENGERRFINVPVQIDGKPPIKLGKPIATIENEHWDEYTDERVPKQATISNIPIFLEEAKKEEAKPQYDDIHARNNAKLINNDNLPF